MNRLILALSVFLISFSAFAGGVQVDGVAAATMNNTCKFTSLTPTANSVTVVWTEGRSDGTMVMKYGTTNPPTTSKVVVAAERSAKSVTLTGLQPSTTYYVEIVVAKTGETSYGASGSVATLASTAVRSMGIVRNNNVTVLQNDRTITVQSSEKLQDVSSVKLFNVMGVAVNLNSMQLEHNGYQMSINTGSIAQGKYVLKVNANGDVIDRTIIIR